MTNFSAAFEGNSGNYRISLKFYSYKYTILAETQVGALFATPFMYTSDFRVQSSGQEPPAIQAARASVGNDLTLTSNVRTTKGQSNINNMYAKYKRLGLISPDLPELSVPSLLARLELLEKNILQGFGQTDFTPLSDIQNYIKLLKDIKEPILLAFSTASSESAMPKTIEALEKHGISNRIVSFVLPLGYSFNLDGSIMYMTFATVFIAQSYGIDISMADQIKMMLILLITSKGMAGVPRASLVVIAGMLTMFKIPSEGLLLLLAVDQLLDMGRSATNVVGNAVASAVVARLEGEKF